MKLSWFMFLLEKNTHCDHRQEQPFLLGVVDKASVQAQVLCERQSRAGKRVPWDEKCWEWVSRGCEVVSRCSWMFSVSYV